MPECIHRIATARVRRLSCAELRQRCSRHPFGAPRGAACVPSYAKEQRRVDTHRVQRCAAGPRAPSPSRRRLTFNPPPAGKGGKNRRRGKNENDEKRELVFKEDGQGVCGAAGWRAAAAKQRLLRELTTASASPPAPPPGLASRRVRPGAPHAWCVRRRLQLGVFQAQAAAAVRLVSFLGVWARQP